ncbi:MFS transporter [Kitasatospora sp. NPDC089509]|uniref:MFS transporter n=1 Tax=Kitasatospora sp. NPDC089509 TaxID=3364079 RepID=UPI00380F4773
MADDSAGSSPAAAPPPVRGAVPVLMFAQGVGVAGTQVTALALPALAILLLDTGPLAASLLFALEYGAQGLTGPFAGVLVDRVVSRRRLLVAVDVVQLLLIATVPLAYVVGALTLVHLCVVAAVSGALGGLSAIAVPTVVADLVPKDGLVAVNAKLAGARSAGQIAGPGLAAALVQWVGAASAMLADAVGHGLSALALSLLRLRPRLPQGGESERSAARPGVVESLREGVDVLRERPLLARLAVAAAALNLGGAGLAGLFAYFAYQVLGLGPGELGLTQAVYSIAAVTAVLTARRVIRRVGLTRVIPLFGPLAAATLFLIPLASLGAALPVLIVYQLVFGFCATVWGVSWLTLQQQLSPPGQLGRVLGLSRSIGQLVMPVGALLGGALAGAVGTTAALAVFAAIALAGSLAVVTARPGPAVAVGSGA